MVPLSAEICNFPNNLRRNALASIEPTAQAGPPVGEIDVLRRVLALIAERIPTGWAFNLTRDDVIPGGSRVDAIAELSGPGQEKAVLVIEAKRSAVTRDLPSVVAQLRSYLTRVPGPAVPVVAAGYLSPSARAWLEEHDVS
jgi:hypothetical protein